MSDEHNAEMGRIVETLAPLVEGNSMLSKRISMEYKDDGEMTIYSFTSNPESLFRIDGQFWHIYGTEASALDSRTGAILETMLLKS